MINQGNLATQRNPFILSVRLRLLLGILGTVLIPLAVLLFIGITTFSKSLADEVDVGLNSIVSTESHSIANLLTSQLQLAQLFANNDQIEEAAKASNESWRTFDGDATQEINRINQQWIEATQNDTSIPVMNRVVSEVSNPVAKQIAEFVAQYPFVSKVLLVDERGVLIAASEVTSNYMQGAEEWRQEAWSGGAGVIWINEQITFDESTGASILQIAIPIKSEDVTVGVLRVDMDQNLLIQALQNVEIGETGRVLIVDEIANIQAVALESDRNIEFPIDYVRVEHVGDQFNTIDVNGTSTVIEAYPISTDDRVSPIDGLGWRVVLLQAESEVFAPVSNAINAIIIPFSILIIIVIAVAYFLATTIIRPLGILVEAAERIGQNRDFSTRVDIRGNDEFGLLGNAFNTMLQELGEMLSSLEERVEARTSDLETTSEIASTANQIRDREQLVSLMVNLVRDRFNFYYVQSYLVDERAEQAILAEGTGYAGRQLLTRGHHLPLDGTSLVSTAISENRIVVVQDTKSDSRWLPNELLPETRSEIVIPLRVKEEVIGVLDIQHNVPNAFDQSNQQLFQTLANQLAITFENVNLLQNTDARARQLETVTQVSIEASTNLDLGNLLRIACKLTRDNFGLYHAHVYLVDSTGRRLNLAGGAGEAGLEMVANKHHIALNNEKSLVARAARTAKGVTANDITQAEDFLANPLLPDTRSEMSLPMVIGDELIGVLDVQSEQVGRFGDEDVQVLSVLASQLAVAVKNARLFKEVEDVRYALDQHAIVAITDQTGIINFVNDKFVEISKYTREELIGQDHRILNSGYHPKEFMRDLWTTIANGHVWKNEVKNKAKDGSYYWVDTTIVPFLNDEGKPYQYVAIRADITDRKAQEEQITRRAAELETVAQVGIEATTNLEVQEVLVTASNMTKENFGLYHAHIYLLDSTGNRLNLTAGAGKAGTEMVANKHHIALNNEKSLVARAARTLKGVTENDITQAEDFLANPLLPDTRSEMSLPMLIGNELIGVLDVQSEQVGRFGNEDIRVLSVLATQLAVAVKNARLFKEVEDVRYALDQHAIVAITDQRGIINYVNDKFVEISKYSREELIGQDHRILNSGYHSKEFMRDLWTTIANGHVWQNEVKNKAKDGSYYWVDTTIVPFLNDDGKPYQYVAIRADVTDRKVQEDQITRRAAELETVAQVGIEATTNLEVQEVLITASNMTKENFGLYHAHIYLLDSTGYRLNLTAGAGKAGEEMVANKHRIALNNENSLVARAARTLKGITANDVTLAEEFLPNPLLPYTRSEMALPMSIGNELIGVLDVQSEHVGRFDEEDIRVLSVLATQLAVAVKNARLFKEVEDVRYALDQHAIVAVTDQTGIINFVNDKFVEISKYSREELIGQDHRILNSGFHSKEFMRDLWTTIANGDVWQNEVKNRAKDGSYYWVDTTIVPFLNDDGKPYQYVAIRADVTERKAQEEQIVRRAAELETVAQVGIEATTNLEVQEVLVTASNMTKDNFGLYHAHIYLLDSTGYRLNLAAGAGAVGRRMVSSKHHIALNNEKSLVARAARTLKGVTENDITLAEDFLPNPHLPNTHSEMALPMMIGNELIGVMDVQSELIGRFDEEDIRVLSVLATQLAVAVKNARLFKEVEDVRYALDQHAIVAITDQRGIINYVNDQFVQISKYSREELIGQDHRILNSGYHSKDFMRDLWTTIANGHVWKKEVKNQAKDGSYYWVDTTIVPFLNDDGKPYQYVAIRADITERKAQEEQIARRAAELETIARVSTATTTLTKTDELLQSVADLTKESFGFYHAHIYLLDTEENELVLGGGAGEAGRTMRERGHKLDANGTGLVARAARSRTVVIENDVKAIEDFLPNPLLPDTNAEMAVPMIVGDDVVGVIDIQSDELNRFTPDDARLQRTLADQVAVAVRNAQAFERERRTVERLREVDRLKQEFLANMSHELRTPLNSIIGYSEVLLDGVDGELNEDATEDVEAIYGSGKHLLNIINEILDLAKIDAGQMRLSTSPKDITEILKHIVTSSQVLVKDKDVEIKLEEITPVELVEIDPIRVNQIMLNLVGNAIKFTEQGSITVRYGMTDENMVRVEVEDSGTGMSAEQLDVIFERFRQVDGSSTRRAGGTGLGLTITKQFVEMHGGEIGVDSEVGYGTTFWFVLPTAAEVAARKARAEEELDDDTILEAGD